MNKSNNQTPLRQMLMFSWVSLAACATAQAQTPPSWLDWNSSPPQNTAPAQTQLPAQATPAPSAVTTHPLNSQPLGAGDAVSGGSGQTVIIQNLLDNVSRLQEQVRDLRGQVEEQNNQIQRLQKAQQSGFGTFDDRLTKLEQGSGGASAPNATPPAAPSAPAAPAVSAPSTPAPPVASVPSEAAVNPAPSVPGNPATDSKQQNLYNAAFAQLKEGHYDQAVIGFQASIDADPQGQWVPSALFWQGETYYVQQKRTQADAAYQKILTQFPKSDRVPDALLKTGYIAYDDSKNAQAKAIFQQVIAQYPQSQAANLAKQRLARMVSEKR